MSIYLGNLSIEDVQKRAGIEFPEELIAYMKPRRQEVASKIAAGKWHCYDIPFMLVCGDFSTAKEIYNHLAPLSSKFVEKMEIGIES